jgi:hypothetical protein
MESETKQVQQKKKNMNVLDILKETLAIYFKNINFIIFTFLTSLPYFFLMLYFETLFQKVLVQIPQIISSSPMLEKNQIHLYKSKSLSYINEPSFGSDYLPLLIQLGFIYIVPFHVFEFCSAVVTIDLASKLSSEENNNNMSLKQMFQNSIDISIMKSTFITSLYMLGLSTYALIAFASTVNICYSMYCAFGCYIFFATICCVAIGKLLMVYLEWSAIWNMSIVISLLEGIYGIGALRVSYFFSSGGNHQKRGQILMLVFFIYGASLRFICIYFGCYKGGNGIFLLIGIFNVVNTLKWVSSVIYFNDCKERKMEIMKVDDEEIGKIQLESNSSKT